MVESLPKHLQRDIPGRVQLSTGRSVSLNEAVLALARLDDLAHGDSVAKEELYYLRQLSLGNSVPEDVHQRLIDIGTLKENGTLSPSMSAVILAAVRGTGRALSVDTNPFVEDWVRTLVDLARCQERVRSDLSPEFAERTLQQVPYVLSDSNSPHISRDSRLFDWSDRIKADRQRFDHQNELNQ
jgi:hypothetical protein